LQILVVDDNEFNRDIAEHVLTDLGHEVTLATNGLEAVKLLTLYQYDAVIMDCQMPVMDGYTATRIIRGSSALLNSKIPILVFNCNI